MGRVFTMNGRKFYSIMDMAREAGVERIYVRDFDKFGIKEITGTPEADEPDNPVDLAETKKAEKSVAVELSDVKEEVAPTKEKVKEEKAEEPKKAEKPEKKEYTIDELVKSSIEVFSKYLHTISLDNLVDFCSKDGLETYDEVADLKIKRMRIVMAIKGKYFKGQKVPKKEPAFKGVVLGDLIQFAKDNEIEYRETGEPKTQRMWVVHALTKAGYTKIPEDDKGGEVSVS